MRQLVLRFVGMISAVAVTSACSSFQRDNELREPASNHAAVAAAWAPLKEVHQALQIVSSGTYNDDTCAQTLHEISNRFKAVRFQQYSNAELQAVAKPAMQASWNLRLAIHQRLAYTGPSCALLAREVFHHARDFEDYLGEFAYRTQPLDPAKVDFQTQAVPIYDRKAYPPYFVREDADTEKFEFRAGDLMLARGISYRSAVITQISDNRSHFSHTVVTNVDPQTKVPNTVESYIGVGVANYQMDYALKNENVRLLVLRPKDVALGAEAARFATKAAQEKVPYDYASDFKDYSKMSCVEVAVYGYDKASQGKVMVPAQPAKITMNNSAFLKTMNLQKGPMITPDDLEVDPNFEMILDWKDYRLVRDSRQKDALLSEIMRWISDMNYTFHDSVLSLAAKNVIYPARRTPLWPLLRKFDVVPDIDRGIPRKTLGLMQVLGEIGDGLLAELRTQDDAYFARHQRPMTNQELREVLENYRQKDLAVYKQKGKSPLHSYLRASNSP